MKKVTLVAAVSVVGMGGTALATGGTLYDNGGPDGSNGYSNGKPKIDAALLERAGALLVESNGEAETSRDEQFARFQSDAPPCDNCGSITVRNGNCYLCHNCGNSMGCS